MNFSDNAARTNLEIVFVKRTETEMEAREEYNSNLWEIEKYDIKPKVNLYATPARDVKIGEDIFSKKGEFIAFRSN